MSESLKPIPDFANEAEERAFWESPGNDSTEYLDWSRAKLVDFSQLQGGLPSKREKAAEHALPQAGGGEAV